MTKQGTGALYLNGANTYLGTTLVSAGTLGGNGTIAGPVTIAAGATLSPGASIGVLTLNSTLSLSGTSTTIMELSKNAGTNDSLVIPAITYAGTLVLRTLDATILSPGDTFKLFTATTYGGSFNVVSQTPGQTVTWDTSKLTVDGTVKVLTATATPATISTSVSGGNLNLTWPANQLGYRLEVQTNPLSVGLGSNWITVPGSTAVTSVSVPISTTTPTAFYRLVFP
ncbi:MAG: autotransporter-associated beta strand repeat-containing protein [Verrucomicrobiota bacterium]